MNKEKFIVKLEEKTNYSSDRCVLINKILERHFLFGKCCKSKIIDDLVLNGFTLSDAENIYDISREIIVLGIKNKLKNPFKFNG